MELWHDDFCGDRKKWSWSWQEQSKQLNIRDVIDFSICIDLYQQRFICCIFTWWRCAVSQFSLSRITFPYCNREFSQLSIIIWHIKKCFVKAYFAFERSTVIIWTEGPQHPCMSRFLKGAFSWYLFHNFVLMFNATATEVKGKTTKPREDSLWPGLECNTFWCWWYGLNQSMQVVMFPSFQVVMFPFQVVMVEECFHSKLWCFQVSKLWGFQVSKLWWWENVSIPSCGVSKLWCLHSKLWLWENFSIPSSGVSKFPSCDAGRMFPFQAPRGGSVGRVKGCRKLLDT